MGPMLRGEVSRIDLDFTVTPEPLSGAEFTGGLHATGQILDRAGYMRLELQAEIPYLAPCARCLDEVSGVFSMELERTVAPEGTLSEEQLEENVDEYAVIEKGKLDLGALVLEELSLSFPQRFLCSEDCPGLCPKCGKPRRLGDCGCSTVEIDPRLAVLKTLLDEMDEK